MHTVEAAGFTRTGFHMLGVFEMKECPELCIDFQNNIAAVSAVTAVRTAVWHAFGTEKMGRPGTSGT